ncbi:MAG: hypothetical protein MZU95_15805 [Desulfomicrobium escambiense]|nr:hypothetical protein [Desulfomicrobium escambiense]
MSRFARLLEIPFMLVGLFFTWFGPFLQELGGDGAVRRQGHPPRSRAGRSSGAN